MLIYSNQWIRLQKLEMPEVEGESYGVLFFLQKRGIEIMIIETFLTYQQLLNKQEDKKDLIINDFIFAEEKIKEYGYFNIIGGYKVPFTNPSTNIIGI